MRPLTSEITDVIWTGISRSQCCFLDDGVECTLAPGWSPEHSLPLSGLLVCINTTYKSCLGSPFWGPKKYF